MNKNTPALALSKDELFEKFRAGEKGLSQEDAEKRLAEYGQNEISRKKGKSALKILLQQFINPLILILIGASVISFFLAETTDSIIIIAIVFLNSLLGFFQEYKAEKIVRELKKLIPVETTVIRNGEKKKIPAHLLVPGDIVELSIGDIIPADIRLIAAEEITVDESSLTGESVPVSKTLEPIAADISLPQEIKNMVFMGTHVANGSGLGVVTSTGDNTYFGKTAAYLKEPEEASDFEKGISSFSRLLLKIVIVMTVFIFIANAVLDRGFLESFFFAIAIAVGITPESLPIIITISLSKGAQKMALAKVIVKKLVSIEDIGNMDVLCTDKTGTLTEGHLSLEKCVAPDGKENNGLLTWGLLCNEAVMTTEGKEEGPILDQALWNSPLKDGVLENFHSFTVLDKNEFNFERRRASVVVKSKEGKQFLVAKGAPEAIVSISKKIIKTGGGTDGAIDFDEKEKAAFETLLNNYSKQGYTTMAVALKPWRAETSGKEDEKDMLLAGFFVLLDPPRQSAKKSIRQMEELGVKIKVLSGDDHFVTETICKKVGIEMEGGKVICGAELDKLNDAQFKQIVEKYNIFSRITPAHKYKIVKTLNTGANRTIGFMGDGINDAPALKVADVGISVNTATPIAKEAADIILMQKDLQVVVDGIIEGRKIFTNITKYIINSVSANYGNMFTVALSSLFIKFLPLLPSQILLNNLISDVPMLAIATDNVDSESLKKPKKIDTPMINKMMNVFGLVSTVFDLLFIGVLLLILKTDQFTFRSAWFFESVLTEIAVVFSLRTSKTFFKSKPSTALVLLSIAVIPVIFALLFVPQLAKFFEFNALSGTILGLIAITVSLYFISTEFAKKIFFKKYKFNL